MFETPEFPGEGLSSKLPWPNRDPAEEEKQLDDEIEVADNEIRAVQRVLRIWILIVGVGTILGIMVVYLLNASIVERFGLAAISQTVFLVIFIGVAVSLGVYVRFQIRKLSLHRRRDYSLGKKRVLLRFKSTESVDKAGTASERSGNSTYFDSLVRINVDNLGEYYNLVRTHTDNSFRVSIVVSVVGFLLIGAGLVIGFTNNQNSQTIAYISAAAGIITEFISGIFFYLYNRTIRQLKDYHDSLLAVQNILLSFKIVGDITDDKEKARMVAPMLAYLIGKQPPPAVTSDAPLITTDGTKS